MASNKKIALICPTCLQTAFARLPRVCGGYPTGDIHPLTPMVSASLYHARKAIGVDVAPPRAQSGGGA